MKQIKLLLSIALLSVIVVSCKSSTPNTVAYQAAGVSQVSAQTGLDLWNQAIPILKPSTNTQYAVRGYFDKWKASMLLVCDAGASYAAGYGTTNNAALANTLQYAISNSEQSKNDFLGFLTQVGVQLPNGPTNVSTMALKPIK